VVLPPWRGGDHARADESIERDGCARSPHRGGCAEQAKSVKCVQFADRSDGGCSRGPLRAFLDPTAQPAPHEKNVRNKATVNRFTAPRSDGAIGATREKPEKQSQL
jgi:hypothetical protein